MPDTSVKPAVRFIKSMAGVAPRLKPFLVNSLNLALAQSKVLNAPLNGWIEVNFRNAKNQPTARVKMEVSILKPHLASEIVLAATDGNLRIVPRQVVSINFLQVRIVLFIDDRIVGQLFSSLDGKHLKLVIAELSEARDLGNGVVALEELNYEVNVC